MAGTGTQGIRWESGKAGKTARKRGAGDSNPVVTRYFRTGFNYRSLPLLQPCTKTMLVNSTAQQVLNHCLAVTRHFRRYARAAVRLQRNGELENTGGAAIAELATLLRMWHPLEIAACPALLEYARGIPAGAAIDPGSFIKKKQEELNLNLPLLPLWLIMDREQVIERPVMTELSDLLKRKVDLVPKNGLKRFIRDEVLSSARIIYAQ